MSRWKYTVAARRWYRQATKRDEETRAMLEDSLGSERDVFCSAMATVRTMIDQAIDGKPVEDSNLKARVAIADRDYVLLWSSWGDVLTGRYSSAAEHWRSLYESPHFLVAFGYEPGLAKEWLGNSRFDVHSARRAVRRFLADGLDEGAATDWLTQRTKNDKEIQAFSHVTPESCIGALAVSDDGAGALLRSQPSIARTRETALFLAKSAVELLRACWLGFPDVPAVQSTWETCGEHVVEDGKEILLRVYEELGLGASDDSPPRLEKSQ